MYVFCSADPATCDVLLYTAAAAAVYALKYMYPVVYRPTACRLQTNVEVFAAAAAVVYSTVLLPLICTQIHSG